MKRDTLDDEEDSSSIQAPVPVRPMKKQRGAPTC